MESEEGERHRSVGVEKNGQKLAGGGGEKRGSRIRTSYNCSRRKIELCDLQYMLHCQLRQLFLTSFCPD